MNLVESWTRTVSEAPMNTVWKDWCTSWSRGYIPGCLLCRNTYWVIILTTPQVLSCKPELNYKTSHYSHHFLIFQLLKDCFVLDWVILCDNTEHGFISVLSVRSHVLSVIQDNVLPWLQPDEPQGPPPLHQPFSNCLVGWLQSAREAVESKS